MKRCWMLLAAVALLAALVFAVRGGGWPAAQQTPLAPQAERDFMSVSLTYDAGTRTLRGTQTLTATNRTGEALAEAVLRLYMNREAASSVTVSGVAADGQSVPFAPDEDDPTVLRIALDWQPGQTVELSWTVMLKHPASEGAAIVTLPALAVYENGAWRTDAYDELAEPAYAQAFDYALTLDGALHSQMRGARDVSIALLGEGKARRREVGGVTVTALAATSGGAKALLDRAQEALADLEAIGLGYPFTALTIAQGGGGFSDGVSLSGLIALSPEGDKEALRRRVTRLVARQTFGVLVESDPWNAPWLSVSLASGAELLAYRQRRGEAAYEARFFEEIEVATRLTRPAGVTVGAGTAFFGSEQEMTQVLRDQGAAMLLGIAEAAGADALLAALQAYARENAGKIASREALEAALLGETGSDWRGYLTDELAW